MRENNIWNICINIKYTIINIVFITFDSEVQFVRDSLSLGVECGTSVPSAAVPRYFLQHEALVAVEDPSGGVVCQLPILRTI